MKPLLCKVLVGNKSVHDNTGSAWSLPKRDAKGTWTPGEWRTDGLPDNTLTTEPVQWSAAGARVYLAEAVKPKFIGDMLGLVITKRARLLRELTDAELLDLHIVLSRGDALPGFMHGAGIWWVGGDAQVQAHHAGCVVNVYDRARVKALGEVRVFAHDFSNVSAFNYAHVTAHHHAKVNAFDDSHVDMFDDSHVDATDKAHVNAHDRAVVTANCYASVQASGMAKVALYSNTFARVSGNARVDAADTSIVFARDSASVALRNDAIARVGGNAQVTACDSAIVDMQRSVGSPHVTAMDRSLVHVADSCDIACYTLQDNAACVDLRSSKHRVELASKTTRVIRKKASAP